MKPMLSTPMTRERLLQVCADPDWIVSEKMDGHRLLVQLGGGLHGFARNGNRVGIPAIVQNALLPLARDGKMFLDGELVHGAYCVFDVVIGDNEPFRARWEALNAVADSIGWMQDSGVVRLVKTVGDELESLGHVRDLIGAGAEGVIARDVTRSYEAGRRSRHCLKLKFIKSVDAIVVAVGRDGKDNLILGAYDGADLVEIGAVSARTGDGPLVKKGNVVEVAYLALGANRRLVQPVTPRLRPDKDPEECLLDQLERE